jgi:hypothetical protein
MSLRHPFRGGVKFRISLQYDGHSPAIDFDDIPDQGRMDYRDIVSVNNGTVHHVGRWNGISGEAGGFGHYVVIRGDDGRYYYYAHLAEFPSHLVVGESVNTGEYIGILGSTGNSTGPHLHFEVRTVYGDPSSRVTPVFAGDNNGSGILDSGDHNGTNGHLVSDNIVDARFTPPPVDPAPEPEPFDPRSIFFSPVASINSSTDGRDELIFRREDGMVTNMITRTNGRSWRHRAVGHAGKEHTLLGGGNITGGIHSSDELIFRTDNNKLARFTVDSRGVANNWSDFADIGRDDVVVGIENIDTNSYDDILLFNPKSGGISAIMMNNGRARWQAVGKVGTDQRFVGAADFDGDGRHDELLFANHRGEIHQMHLRSNGTSSGWSKVGDFAPHLQIVGPWNADGSGDDILFRDKETGHFGIFDMDPRTQKVKHFEWVGHANPDQEVVGVGDITSVYAGEEVFLRHAGSGDINAFGSQGTIFDEHYRYGRATMGHITMGVQSSEMIAEYF